MIQMETHIKPAVTFGKVVFEQEIVDELIEEVERLRNTGDNAGDKLVGQLHNDERADQVSLDFNTDVGKMWKKLMNGIGDKYLTDMIEGWPNLNVLKRGQITHMLETIIHFILMVAKLTLAYLDLCGSKIQSALKKHGMSGFQNFQRTHQRFQT